jgi:hypothetical protein
MDKVVLTLLMGTEFFAIIALVYENTKCIIQYSSGLKKRRLQTLHPRASPFEGVQILTIFIKCL